MRATHTHTVSATEIRVTLREAHRVVRIVTCGSRRQADALQARWISGRPAPER